MICDNRSISQETVSLAKTRLRLESQRPLFKSFLPCLLFCGGQLLQRTRVWSEDDIRATRDLTSQSCPLGESTTALNGATCYEWGFHFRTPPTKSDSTNHCQISLSAATTTEASPLAGMRQYDLSTHINYAWHPSLQFRAVPHQVPPVMHIRCSPPFLPSR